MTQTKIFKINDLVDLRLIGKRTYIYINNKRFLACIRLLIDIPVERIQEVDEIKSIDEAAEVFKQSLWQNKIVEGPMAKRSHFQNTDISPEEEFRGHCSNIQVFFENGLSTDILASNISFPLLKKLVDLGYEPATRVLKEEIAKRFNEGIYNSRLFLYEGEYLDYLNREEKQALKGYNGFLVERDQIKKELENQKLGERIRERRLERFKDKEIEWLKSEYGTNPETLQEKLKEWEEDKMSFINASRYRRKRR